MFIIQVHLSNARGGNGMTVAMGDLKGTNSGNERTVKGFRYSIRLLDNILRLYTA
jgi:hypothetical protein